MDNIYWDITKLSFDDERWKSLYLDLVFCSKSNYYKANKVYRRNIDNKMKYIEKIHLNS